MVTWQVPSLRERSGGQLQARAAGPEHLKVEGRPGRAHKVEWGAVYDWDVDPWV